MLFLQWPWSYDYVHEILLCILLFAICCWAQSDARPEILVLGTYHMANPGRDLANIHADDVLSPKRQKELTELLDVLKRFQPHEDCIEADVGSERVVRDYSEYVAGKFKLSRNEIDQIGYWLAKEPSLHCSPALGCNGR